jgi:D-sedoheptulose 7-phosphate isomerase
LTTAYVREYLSGVQSLLADVSESAMEAVIDLLWDNYSQGRRVVFCGNGGSAATASHLPADFQKNMFLDGGRPWECMSVVDSIPLLTAWGNDTHYTNVFAGQVRTWLRPGDLMIAISGSGNSPNILAAIDAAHECGAVTIGICGYGGGKLSQAAHHSLIVHSDNMQMVEDVHMVLGHALYSALRERLLASQKC